MGCSKIGSIMNLLMRVAPVPLCVGILVLSASAQVELAGCKSYGPAKVALHGKLVQKTYPGPPNYADVRGGDKAETYWLLKLDSPLCVDADKAEPDLNPRQEDVRVVELVLNEDAYAKYREFVGKRVVATGSLFGAHTGHHHTPVLLTVSDIQAPRWK